MKGRYYIFSWVDTYVFVAKIPKISFLKYTKMNKSINLAPFTITLGFFHVVIFIVSIILNLLASDYASYGRKLGADQKFRLFRRLTVLQCRIAQFDNLMRLPLIIKLFYYNNNNGILQVWLDLGWVFFNFNISRSFSCIFYELLWGF